MPVAHVRGADISWSATGQGTTVIFAHGLTSSRTSSGTRVDWSPVARGGHRLVTFDSRGHGLSSGRAIATDYEWPALAKDLIALVREIAPGESVVGMGSSMGAATLIYAALEAPGLFSRLILAAPPTAWETRKGQSEVYNLMAETIEKDGMQAYLDMRAGRPRPKMFAGLERDVEPPDIDERVFPSVLRGAGNSDLPAETAVSSISAPTLILAWTGDSGHPVSSALRLHELIPSSQLSIAESLAEYLAWGQLAAEFIDR